MLLGIVLIVLGVVGGLSEFIPERHRRLYRLIVAGLAIAFGIVNLTIQQHGSGQLLAKIDRYGTALSWQAAEATLEVEGPETKKQAQYSLSVKIIPRDHERVKHLNLRLRKGHASVEPDYIDDTTARWLFWIMQDPTGTVDVDQERASGIDTYYFFGRFDEKVNLVKLYPERALYLPSLYASLRDLEDKYIVVRIMSAGVDRPMFTELGLKFESPTGPQLLVMLPTQLQWAPGAPGSRTVVTSPERYIGGLLSAGHFLSVSR
jgi:hypothetical protein